MRWGLLLIVLLFVLSLCIVVVLLCCDLVTGSLWLFTCWFDCLLVVCAGCLRVCPG